MDAQHVASRKLAHDFFRVGETTARHSDELLELQTELQSGPSFDSETHLMSAVAQVVDRLFFVTDSALLKVSGRNLTPADASAELDLLDDHMMDMTLPLDERQMWSEAAARLRAHFGGSFPHGAREAKPVSEILRLFKTVARVTRSQGDKNIGLAASVQSAEDFMPFIRSHFSRLRGEACTDRQLHKLAATTETLMSYKTGDGLSPSRTRLRQIALEILAAGRALSEAEASALLGVEQEPVTTV